jgi:L-ribulose-5-phosphate 3-epimerase
MTSRHLALCSWSLQPNTPEELVAMTQKCGLNAVQLALVPIVQQEPWKHASEVFLDAGLGVVSGMLETVGEDYSSLEAIARTGGIRPDETWNDNLEIATHASELASRMSVDLVTFHAGFLPEEQCDERLKMLGRLEVFGDIFGKHGIELALETGQEDAPTLVAVLEELSHPMIGVNFDPANMLLYGKGDPIDAIEQLNPWVKQVHIKDANASLVQGQWGEEVAVGDGQVDWELFLKKIPSEVNLVIEREAGDQRIEDITQAVTVVRKFVSC